MSTATLLLLLLATSSPAPSPQAGALGNADVPRDDQKGPNPNFERAQLQPLELSADGRRLYALNSAGARLAGFDVASGAHVLDIAVGIGGVSVARRPGTEELWVVDSLASTVFVVDPAQAAIVRSVRVGAQPHGIAFTPDGDRAYVTCSGVDRVDVLHGATARVVRSIPVPVKQPRGIVWAAGHAWVVPLLSGNNTAPHGRPGAPDHVVGVARVEGAGLNALPDRDLLAIATRPDPAKDRLVDALTRTGLGTILFGVTRRPGSDELWIPNTEALNADFTGERSFVEGQVVSNRITRVRFGTGAPAQVIDLDALAPAGERLAQPTHVAFDAAGQRAYVCGFGSERIGVLDVLPGGQVRWAGSIALTPIQSYPDGAGPRQALVHPTGRQLFVYHRLGNALGTVDLASLPSGGGPFSVVAPPPVPLGFEALTGEERHGRFLFSDARLSRSGTSSCASCHVDRHTDGLAWDLSIYLDPEGTPAGQQSFPLDDKGPLVTQSNRRLQETGPYHWRGERAGLLEFNATFASLLEHEVDGEPAGIDSFGYLMHFINNLRWPPNPRTPLDRDYTPAQLAGADLFMNKPVLGRHTCASCHQLPLGTSGEIVTTVVEGKIVSAVVPPLRGVADKLSPPHSIGGVFGTRTELGAGLSHGGARATLRDVVLGGGPLEHGGMTFDLTPQEADRIVAFLEAFDWGLAPAAGYAATANAANLASFAGTELLFLEDQAERGNCDLVYLREPRLLPGGQGLVQLTGRYNPETRRYTPATRWAGELTSAQILADAAQGGAVTFLGLPLGMGESIGLDRDMDGLWDLDELRFGSDPEVFDSDGDSFPDGWEVERGLDPTAPDSGAADSEPPALAGGVRVHWATTTTVKFEFDTTEMSRVHLAYNGQYPVQRLPLGPPDYATHHDVVLGGLEPGSEYRLDLELFDPAGNVRLDSSTVVQTRRRLFGEPTRVDTIRLRTMGSQPTELVADVQLLTAERPAGAGYRVEGRVFQVFLGGRLQLVSDGVGAATGPQGVASLRVPLPASGPPSTVLFVVQGVTAPPGAAPYVPSLNEVSSAGLAW
jgi:DNA-binding beta-propeller fold protein YncE